MTNNDKGKLIFSRREGESIIIGDEEIIITILETIGSQVKLVIKAPKAWSVHREEIFEKIKKGDKDGNRIISNGEIG